MELNEIIHSASHLSARILNFSSRGTNKQYRKIPYDLSIQLEFGEQSIEKNMFSKTIFWGALSGCDNLVPIDFLGM